MTTMMKHLTTTLLVLICFNNPAIAGVIPVNLSCKAKDTAERIAGIEGAIEVNMKTNINTERGFTYITDKDSDTNLVQDLGQGVFTVVARKRGTSEEISIYAIPKTVKVKREANAIQAKFDAVLNVSISQTKNATKNVMVACIYNYNH